MKKLTLTLCALAAFAGAAYAGTQMYSGKEMKQTETPCPTWYADNEWNIGISGIYAPSVNGDDEDVFLGDDSWGFGVDIKYFFHRYFGFGVQGFGLATDRGDVVINGVRFDTEDDDDWAGGALGTFTLRYPIPCSRWSPYAWWGVGGVWGGGDRNVIVPGAGVFRVGSDDDARLMGQYGVGIEARFTNHIGWTLDGSYNQVEGGHNDFWMLRTGINFAF